MPRVTHTCLLAAVLALFIMCCTLSGAAAGITREVYLMGTRCILTSYAPDSQEGHQELERYIEILEGVEQELSTWRRDTVLGRLNAHPVGDEFALEPRLFELVRRLVYWRNYTLGHFDPAIGQLLHAWDLYGEGAIPSNDALEAARQSSGMEHIELLPDSRRVIRRKDVLLDSGAFGKGEALDRVFQRSPQNGRWLINLGGQVMVHGRRPDGSCWPVSIAHPADRDQRTIPLDLCSGSIATSGGSERNIERDGERIGHILDPETGLPATFDGSVSVWADSASTADILSTALYVMGPDKGIAWAAAERIAAFFLIPAGGGALRIEPTPAFEQEFGPLPNILLTAGRH